MKGLWIALALVMLVFPAAAWSMGSTLNKDFEAGFQENGVANGWYGYQLYTLPGVPTADTTLFHGTAGASQKVTATTDVSQGGIKAKFDGLSEGHIYTVKVWVNVVDLGIGGYSSLGVRGDAEENEVAVNDPQLYGYWAAGNDGAYSTGTAGAWVQLSRTVTVNGGHALTVFLDSYASTANWDDLTITDDGVDPNYVLLTGPKPVMIWNEVAYWQNSRWFVEHQAGNPMGHGQVLIDGNKSIIAEGNGGLLLYADEQTDGTAFVKSTPLWNSYPFLPGSEGWPENSNYTSKGGTMLNGRLYSIDMQCDIHQMNTWEGPAFPYVNTVDGPWGLPMATGMTVPASDMDNYGLVTDGTYLYGYDTNTDTTNHAGPCSIYKWSVNAAGNGGNGTLHEEWKVTVPSATWLRSIGIYNGKLYAAEAFSGRNIWEINCSDGTSSSLLSGNNLIPIASTGGWYMGQIARLGNRMVLADHPGHVTQWVLTAGTWTLESSWSGLSVPGAKDEFYGISLKAGPDGNAKYAWVSGLNNVYFYDLTPATAVGKAKDAPWKNGYQVWADDLVVTTQAPTGTGFWVENVDRTMAAFVPTAETKTTGNLVTIKGIISRNDSGERVLTPSEAITEGAAASLKPLMMTHRSMGPATGGVGLATDGMLVKISGKVTGISGSQGFFLDDGSGVPSDSSPILGVKVVLASGGFMDAEGVNNWQMIFESPQPCTAVVTGVVRLEKIGDTVYRRIDARSAADIVITAL